MDHQFNTYINNNVGYRQKSQTLQPIRGSPLDLTNSKQFILCKYFELMDKSNLAESERANYANVPLEHDDASLIHQRPPPPPGSINRESIHNHHHHQHHHHHPDLHHQHHLHNHHLIHQHQQQEQHRSPHCRSLHHRSQSQHYFQPNKLCQVNDPNNYYNISNMGATVIPSRSRHPSPLNVVDHQSLQTPIHNHHIQPINEITLLQVCYELGMNLDSPPPIPSPRNYTISATRNCGLFKVALPQRRYVKGQFTDLVSGISLTPGTQVSVLHPSKEDRSKFTVCLNDQHHIDMPHHLTQAPQPTTPHWNY